MRMRDLAVTATFILLGMVSPALAQAKDPAPSKPAAKGAEPAKRAGDAYPLGTCPVSENKLTPGNAAASSLWPNALNATPSSLRRVTRRKNGGRFSRAWPAGPGSTPKMPGALRHTF